VVQIAGSRITRQPVAEHAPAAVRSWNPSDRLMALLFTAPTLAFIFFLYAFPLLWTLAVSFTSYSATKPVPTTFVGIDNFVTILGRESIWQAFGTTGRYVALAVGSEFLLGLGLALLLNRRFRGRGLITILLLLPMMLSPVLASMFWFRMGFHPQGSLINYYIASLGLTPPDWLGNPSSAFVALLVMDIWQWTPFMLLLALAGLSSVPGYLYEAAEVDQASTWFKFRHITLPSIWPLLLIALIFRTVDAVRAFEYQWTTVGVAQLNPTVPIALYSLAFRYWETGLSGAFAWIVVVLALAFTSIFVHFLKRAGHH
jgi:multiple sugar transport system permease protein